MVSQLVAASPVFSQRLLGFAPFSVLYEKPLSFLSAVIIISNNTSGAFYSAFPQCFPDYHPLC